MARRMPAGRLAGAAPPMVRRLPRPRRLSGDPDEIGEERVFRPEPAPDEVDRIVADWRRERPDLAVEPLEVLSRITRLSRHLDLARRSAFGARGLEAWEFDVLSALRRAGPPYELSPGRLVDRNLVTSGTMTNRVDRLARRGFVQRRPDPDDRRGVLVGLTDAGRTVVDGALDDLLARERVLLEPLPHAERDRLAALLRAMLAQFDQPARATSGLDRASDSSAARPSG